MVSLVSRCDKESIVSYRGDVAKLVRSMGSDWLQKARLLPEESGLGDSGAQISVTNVATASKFGLKMHKYDKPIRIGFAQGADVMATEFVVMGPVLGEVPVLEAETIFSLWSICENGYEIVLDSDRIIIRDKVSGETVYQAASCPMEKEWRLGVREMMDLEPNGDIMTTESVGGESSVLVRAGKLLNRDRGDVVKTSVSKRGAPRITQRIKNAIIWMHNCLCHTASPGSIAAALRNGEAWSGIDVEFTAAMVETVFKYHTCIACQIAKWNHPAVGVGSGVDVNQPGHTVYLDVVMGVQPPSNYGNTGFYFAVCNNTGKQFFKAIHSVHQYEAFLRSMHAYFWKHGHRMVNLIFDAARFEMSAENQKLYDELRITPQQIAPEEQERNRAERGIQPFVKSWSATMLSQQTMGGMYWQLCAENCNSVHQYIVNQHSFPLTPIQRIENRGAPDVLKICKFPFGCPTTHVRVGKQKLAPHGKRWASKNVFGFAVGPSIINPQGGATRIMIPGKLKAVDRAHVQHCHVQYQEHLLTAREIEKLANEMEAQLLKADGSFVVKTPSADAMGRSNSALVLNDLMELQLPPLGGPKTIVDEDDDVLGGAETIVEAQVDELYEGDAESEDEGSVADNFEQLEELDDEGIVDISDSGPVTMALDERKPGQRVPRFNYVSLIRHQIDGSSRRILVRRSKLQDDGYKRQENCGMEDWLEKQSCKFGDAGFGRESNVFVDCDDRIIQRIRAVKRKLRTDLNPTMTNAFKTEDGAEEWTPALLKELTTLGPMHSFAMEQIDYCRIPPGAEILMLQPELTTKKATGAKKARIVVNGAQESYKEDEDNYAPTALAKGGQLLFALAVQEDRRKMGIDITAAFASEFLTPEDGDIYVKYPDILVQHFSDLLDQQREEQKEVLATEASAKAAAVVLKSGCFAEASDEERGEEENGSKGSRSKRRRQAMDAASDEESSQIRNVKKGYRSRKWEERKAEKADKQRVRIVSHNSQRRQGYYAKLRKSLYGLRRAAKLFNRGLRELLQANGYESCPADTCIFRKVSGTESILFNTHVDDFACYPTCIAMFDELCAVLRTKYEITVTNNLVKHLGMHVNEYENGSVGISQPKHLQTLFDLCGYGDDHVGASIPMPEDWNEADQDDSPKIDVEPYRKLVGSALFILKSRPDVAIALSKASSRTHKCTEKDMAVLRQTVSYLHATRHFELVYSRDCSKQYDAVLEIFAWADNAFMCYIDSKSQNGYCLSLGNHDTAKFMWYSGKSKCLPLSTCEGETDSAVEVTKEVTWARDVMEFCGHPQRRPTYIGEDNQAMITLASKEAGTHGRTKHFTGRINYLIDNVKNGIIRLEYLRTEEQHADGLTKPFGPKAMKRFQQQMLGTQLHGVMAKKAEVRKVWWNPFGEAKSGKKHRVAFAAGTKEE
jgi:hypothetical protein